MDPIDKGSDIENDTEDVDCFFIHEGDRIIDLPENGIELQASDCSDDDDCGGGTQKMAMEDSTSENEEPVPDMAVVVFAKHSENNHAPDVEPEVYAVEVDPSDSGLAVTGGRDDTAYVWSVSSGEVCFHCTGHYDSVECTSFSHDGKYVATADLKGVLKVWSCDSGHNVWSHDELDADNNGPAINWLLWHPRAHVLLAGTQKGEVWMWNISHLIKMEMEGNTDWSTDCKVFGHASPPVCGKLLPDGRHLCVGYDDGSVKLWDLKGGCCVDSWQHSVMPDYAAWKRAEQEEAVKADPGDVMPLLPASDVAVISIDCCRDGALILSGSNDSTARVFCVRSVQPEVFFMLKKRPEVMLCAGSGAVERGVAVECVSFSPEHRYAVTATSSGVVKIWDSVHWTCRAILHQPHCVGVTKLQWYSTESLHLFAACTDGVIRVWDVCSGGLYTDLTGHRAEITGLAITRDKKFLVSSSLDGTARVFALTSV